MEQNLKKEILSDIFMVGGGGGVKESQKFVRKKSN